MNAISLQRNGVRADIVLGQPERKNAMSQDMWRQLAELLGELKDDLKLRVVVVRGEGDAFCAGADISEFERIYGSSETSVEANRHIGRALDAMDGLPIPSIAAIRGVCMGGGCALAQVCDHQVADQTARFGINQTSLGLSYSPRDCQRLVARIGLARAKAMLIGAQVLDAATALEWGLVSHLVAPAALEKKVDSWASDIGSRSPQALSTLKRIFLKLDHGQSADTSELRELFEGCFKSADLHEGAAAFLQKRPPRFADRQMS